MKIADIFLIHIFMDLYEIYLKPDTFVCELVCIYMGIFETLLTWLDSQTTTLLKKFFSTTL